LASLFDKVSADYPETFKEFHFVFTGGTYKRIVINRRKRYLASNSTILPDRKHGGVTILANLIVQRQCSIIWPFLSPIEAHWLNPENLALMRLCDIWNVKRLMNQGSVETWFQDEAERDAKRNPQEIPLRMRFGGGKLNDDLWKKAPYVDAQWAAQWSKASHYKESNHNNISEILPKERELEFWRGFRNQTIALIAHDEMKRRMVDFAIEYERELSNFGRILATGTTGRDVQDATRELKGKIMQCRSGPKGGDIEIATEVLYGRCDVVIFFIDPLHPHPHIEDIRVVFAACMIENQTRMLTNEVQAREWMDVVVRPALK
jgi:methylglyoxal synthase